MCAYCSQRLYTGDKMMWFSACVLICAFLNTTYGISSKLDFGDDDSKTAVNNSSKMEDEDVEVKHTIVVSTKLKNNNRRGLHSNSDGDSGTLTYSVGTPKSEKADSGEVPIEGGYKAVETTQIKTPDSRYKTKIYPDSVFISRNIRDEYDVIPNIATNPLQWKPSNFFNNINWWNNDYHRRPNYSRGVARPVTNSNGFHNKVSNEGLKEFYCQKCREMSKACIQQRSSPWFHETTTHKVKIDGKLAKLN